MTIGTVVAQLLNARIYDIPHKRAKNKFIIIFGIITGVFSTFVIDPDNDLYDLITFLLVTLEMLLVFIPFTLNSLQIRKKLSEPIYRRSALSLAGMALLFILTLVNFFFDRLLMVLEIDPDGYTFFYFAAWISTVLGILSAYLGYILPGIKQQLPTLENKEELDD